MAAATCWRLAEVAAVARLLDEVDPAELRAVRAVLAASPLVAAAFEEAARDAAFRFDAEGFSAASPEEVVLFFAPAAAAFGARRAAEDPRSTDTPVPVPSGASSSGSTGETEVTTTTYQRAPDRHVHPPPERG